MLEEKQVYKEWAADKKWNPFNSYKLLAQVYRWKLIVEGQPVPQPALVTVDPVNICNLKCIWCNADYILNNRNNRMARETLLEIAQGLGSWQGSPMWPAGVEAVCIAGGGEPLLHPAVGEFINALVEHGIEVGVVTNGVHIDRFIPQLAKCTWVGVSVDAGSEEVFEQLKGKREYTKVCDNIAKLVEYSREHETRLGMDRPGYGVSFKYLLYNGNHVDIYKAAVKAREIGCKNFHLRPAGLAWDKLSTTDGGLLKPEVREYLVREIQAARELEKSDFGVFGITHKFDETLNRSNCFETCHAIFMTCVFMPPRHDGERFSVSLCCDRRGDSRLEFAGDMNSFADLETAWGSKEHWDIFRAINLKHCPRCTYQPHNNIYEQVIENDSMTYKFI
ncbi:MAG: radical SAM protein [Desulfovibrio sp.]|uniref:radical SAM protein n=1 Tax=Desulfovibrio sp. 7SRBS1 TaxID=3378064 RepID=UPI003B3DF7D9